MPRHVPKGNADTLSQGPLFTLAFQADPRAISSQCHEEGIGSDNSPTTYFTENDRLLFHGSSHSDPSKRVPFAEGNENGSNVTFGLRYLHARWKSKRCRRRRTKGELLEVPERNQRFFALKQLRERKQKGVGREMEGYTMLSLNPRNI